ncbi:DUF817 domain-containing protein [Sphingobium nicotianae]|uniref:DUF817 domain-containing protein n=1 Tax=Sphingobium nicotianae TaxID=2782607 RepID=A0A9X1DCW1_9SPHN|nr:DUF817 domain-containing protein [Sphingobium nicotianae]MBT2187706.1 DUF817 domain-containing protein [Sphingobium nicotianae]
MNQTRGATRFARIRARLEAAQPTSGPAAWAYEFLLFGFKQGWACLFGALMLALLLGTHLFYPRTAPLARYDFLTLGALAIQAGMLFFRLESWREAKVIAVFHVVGTIMELFKTGVGSWQYPEAGVLHIAAVPLFSGFMYAAVGSYIARIWRIFRIRFDHYPPRWMTMVLAAAIYVNFFAHHWLPDIRIALFLATGALFWRSRFYFTPFRTERWMPVLLGFLLVSLFIWFAENIGTFAQAWRYPNQRDGWQMVSITKLGAWYLLMIISFVLVSLLHEPEGKTDTSGQ